MSSFQCHFQQITRPSCLGVLSRYCYQYGIQNEASESPVMTHALDDNSRGLLEALQAAKELVLWASDAEQLFLVSTCVAGTGTLRYQLR